MVSLTSCWYRKRYYEIGFYKIVHYTHLLLVIGNAVLRQSFTTLSNVTYSLPDIEEMWWLSKFKKVCNATHSLFIIKWCDETHCPQNVECYSQAVIMMTLSFQKIFNICNSLAVGHKKKVMRLPFTYAMLLTPSTLHSPPIPCGIRVESAESALIPRNDFLFWKM